MARYKWIDAGCYYDDNPHIKILACCFTHKDGRKINHMLLVDETTDINKCKSVTEFNCNSCSIADGAWELIGTPGEINTHCREEMHKICFSPF